MSIRIQSESLTGSSISELSRSEEIARSGAGGARPASGTDAHGHDRVELSGLSDRLTDFLAAANVEHSTKVRQLAAVYAAGRYTVDSMRVSRAMIAESMGTAKSSGE
jgi:hypothetical protein